MNSWHDLRVWLSGLLGALSLAAFVAATLMRARDRALQDEEPALAKRTVAKADVSYKNQDVPPCLSGAGETLEAQAPGFTREIEQGLAVHGRFV